MRMTLLLSCRCQQLLAVFLRSPIEPYPCIWTENEDFIGWPGSVRGDFLHVIGRMMACVCHLMSLAAKTKTVAADNGTRATVDDMSHPAATTRIVDTGLHERVRSVTSPGTNESVGRQRKADFLSNIEESVWPVRVVFHCGSIEGSTATIETSRSRSSVMRADSSALRVSSIS